MALSCWIDDTGLGMCGVMPGNGSDVCPAMSCSTSIAHVLQLHKHMRTYHPGASKSNRTHVREIYAELSITAAHAVPGGRSPFAELITGRE
jgi:hypothetical protein